MRRAVETATLVLALSAAFGCAQKSTQPTPVDTLDAGCPDGACCRAAPRMLDLLLVIDNSNSMSEEQALLGVELPQMVRALASGDRDGDGVSEFAPVADLHLGVVTTDMGVGGFGLPSCPRRFGDDGVLRSESGTRLVGCRGTFPTFLAYGAVGSTDVAQLGADFGCVASTGTNGCGFEQQLEAGLKALTPASSALRFSGDTTGHGDGANVGFRRTEATLALVIVTDEDDCSIRADSEDFFNQSSTAYTGEVFTRCVFHPEAKTPIERYVDGLLAAETDPARLVFAAITGVPSDLGADATHEQLLADPRMVETLDPSADGVRLLPVCSISGVGIAFPARRIVTTARDLAARGARTAVQSICAESFAAPIDAILDAIEAGLGGSCG